LPYGIIPLSTQEEASYGYRRLHGKLQARLETSDENLLASLFTPDGTYRNTPFAVQQGHEAIKQYWQRTKLQTDIKLTYEVLQRHGSGPAWSDRRAW
jgi:hypothetical protein